MAQQHMFYFRSRVSTARASDCAFLSATLYLIATQAVIGNATTDDQTLLQLNAFGSIRRNVEPLNKTETDFVADILTSFGKQAPSYVGAQRLRGFRSAALIDDEGMFAFDSSIKSVAIDVGAADNPLKFDTDRDASQLVLAFEPIFAQQLEVGMEQRAKEAANRGGCTTRWERFCADERLVVFPSAVSTETGHATFHTAANPYCGSLNEIPGNLDPTLVNSSIKEVRDVMSACWGSLNSGDPIIVPTVTLASILRRIPERVRVKYVKIDAQGYDFKILMSAADHMSRIEYVRFEMQVDPPPGRKMVADVPSYAQVESQLVGLGFVHEAGSACDFDTFASPFSREIREQECVFCRKLPCREPPRWG